MPTFIYKARNGDGKPVEGTQEAASIDVLTQELRNIDCMLVHAEEIVPEQERKEIRLHDHFQPIKAEDLILFDVQLAGMIDADLTLLRSLRIIANQVENKKLKEIVHTMIQSVSAGSSFSDALSAHPRVFSPLYVSMVKTGETGGKLNIVLNRLAEYSEKQEDLRRRIREALFYPAILLTAGFAVVMIIVTFVMPKFIDIFDKANVALPLPTLMLHNFGTAVKGYWPVFLLGIVAAAGGLKAYRHSAIGQRQVDHLVLRLPVVGRLARKVVVSRFCRTLATLVDSGVPLLHSLDLIREVVGNSVIARVIQKVHANVEKGERMSPALAASQEFPPDAVQMISVGEEAGKLGQMLNKVADFYDSMISYSVKKLTTLIEPLFIILMGGVVGFIMAAMLLPLFDMVKTLRG